MWMEQENIDGEVDKAYWLDYGPFGLFCIKVVFLLLSFVLLGHEFAQRAFR
jgi:intracellular septation protein A